MNITAKIWTYATHPSKILSRVLMSITRRLPPVLKHKILQNIVYKLIDDKSYKNIRTQTFYLDFDVDPIEFFEALNQRKLEYVLLRSWENLPDYPAGEDIDLLIIDEHRDLINDLVHQEKKGIKCDIYTISGAKNGDRYGIPVFPHRLSHDLITNRIFYKHAYVPSTFHYFASVAYHAIFHKAHNSGIPGFNLQPTKYVFDYTNALIELKSQLKITDLQINVKELFKWLKKQDYAPAEDTLSKLVEINPELDIFQNRLYSDLRGGDLIVYLVRERFLKEGHLEVFKKFLKEKYHFDVIDVVKLNKEEKKICTREIRGGKWDEGPFKSSGGSPVAFLVAFDNAPWPLDSPEAEKQTRVTNKNNLNAKYEFREVVNNSLVNDSFNGIHSSDNEQDAWFYLSLLGREYCHKISQEVEVRRNLQAELRKVK